MNGPKCGGRGHFPEYSGIWSGTCFKCGGLGKVMLKRARKQKKLPPLTDYQVRMVAMIKTCDPTTLSKNELSSLRNFAHWPLKQEPKLLAIWKERCEPTFQERQQQWFSELSANMRHW